MKKTRRFVPGIAVTMLMAVVVAHAQAPSHGEPEALRFEFAPTQSVRGRGVAGWAYNDSAWRLTNVRLRVESIDAGGAVQASASGWVQGDLRAGDRAYFYVAVPSHAPTYRVSVESFDRVAREGRIEAP